MGKRFVQLRFLCFIAITLACALQDCDGGAFNPYGGIIETWNEICDGSLSKLPYVGGKGRFITEAGIGQAWYLATEIFRHWHLFGIYPSAGLVNFIEKKQWMYNDGTPDSQNFVCMVGLLVRTIAMHVYDDLRMAQCITIIDIDRGNWWEQPVPPMTRQDRHAVHDPRTDCLAYLDGFRIEQLLTDIAGYVKYQCDPKITPNDLENGGRGITNLSHTCYMATSLQVLSRLPGVWEEFSKANEIDGTPQGEEERIIRGLTVALTEMRYGRQGSVVSPQLIHRFLTNARRVPTVTKGAPVDLVLDLMDIAHSRTQRGFMEADRELVGYYRPFIHYNPKEGPALTIKKVCIVPCAKNDDVADALNGGVNVASDEKAGPCYITWPASPPLQEVIIRLPIHKEGVDADLHPFNAPLEIYWNRGKWVARPTSDVPTMKYRLHMVVVEHSFGGTACHVCLLHCGPSGKWREINDERVREVQQEEAVKIMCGRRDSRLAGEMVFYRRVDE
jgi:hypothetical protein